MLVVSGYYQLLTTNTTNKKIILNLKFEFYKKDNKKVYSSSKKYHTDKIPN